MSIRENPKGEGTRLEIKSKKYGGSIGMDKEGFSFDKAVAQEKLLTITSGGTVVADVRKGNIYKILLTDATTFDAINAAIGTYIFIFEQDGTGGRAVTFDSKFKFEGGVAPNYSGAAASAINIVSALYDGYNFYCSYLQTLS